MSDGVSRRDRADGDRAAQVINSLRQRNRQLEATITELQARLASCSSTSPRATPDNMSHDARRTHLSDETGEGGQTLATTDVVTGLPNRACFLDRLANAIRCAERHSESFAVLFIDLDEFKTVNDTMGHSAGDKLLSVIAERLTSCVRKSDTVARLGGRRIIKKLLNLKEPELVARVAEKIIATLSQPFPINGRNFFLSASVGIATYPGDGSDVELLIRNADIAMYEVKNSGKNGYHFYTRELSQRAIARLELEDDLRKAIIEEQFEVHYQAVVDSYSETTVAAEALIRWRHPEKGLVMPDDFIPLAEDTGLIVDIGQWVLESACRQARAWQMAGYEPVSVAVNLSMLQFEQDDLIETIMDTLVGTNLDSHWLELELTEGVILENADHAKAVLESLRELGMRVAIDDFGTGYSSLIQLRRLPIDCLKIDRAFVQGVLNDPDDATVVEAIVDLGRKLKLTLVAEGVETSEQLHFLRNLGCQRCQGYLFGKPTPAEEFAGALTMARPMPTNGHAPFQGAIAAAEIKPSIDGSSSTSYDRQT
jgi:diguanylate cyclase (GGDEF)-like protein